MKKNLLLAAIVAGTAFAFSSCNKVDDLTNQPQSTQPNPTTPQVAGVNGAFVSLKVNFTYSVPNMPTTFPIEIDNAVAAVYKSVNDNTMVDAGTVTVNGFSLDKQSNNSYIKMLSGTSTELDLGYSSGSNWQIGGASGVSAFTFNHTSGFPNYSATLPETITRSAGLTLNIASYTSNADSVYVLIAAGNQSVLKHYSASASTITIPASDLSALPSVTDKTAILEVDPFSYVIKTINGNDYAFVKEYAKISYVNIN